MSTFCRILLYLLSFTPLLIYVFGYFFQPGKQADHVDLRPPTWLFGVVWFTVVVGLVATCLALVWKEDPTATVYLCLVSGYVVLACTWLVLFNLKHKTVAAVVLLFATFFAAALLTASFVSKNRSFAFFTPLLLLIWSCFATALNTLESRSS